jgi:hypothetical protein
MAGGSLYPSGSCGRSATALDPMVKTKGELDGLVQRGRMVLA